MLLEKRTKILVEGDFAVFRKLAEKIAENSKVKVIREPQTTLVMVPALDTAEQILFYLGEVLITECTVEVDGTAGYGFVIGDEPEKALCLAILEAALESGNVLTPEIERVLGEQEKVILEKKRRDYNMIARTKVNFETREG